MERCLLVDLESLVEGSDLNLISERKPSQVPVFNLQKIFSWPQIKMNSALPKMLFCKWLSKKGSQNHIRWFLEKSHRKEKEALSLVKGDFKSWPFYQLPLFLSHHPCLEPSCHLGLPHLHPDGGPWRETKLSLAPVLVLLCFYLSEYHAKACSSGRADWQGAGVGGSNCLPPSGHCSRHGVWSSADPQAEQGAHPLFAISSDPVVYQAIPWLSACGRRYNLPPHPPCPFILIPSRD